MFNKIEIPSSICISCWPFLFLFFVRDWRASFLLCESILISANFWLRWFFSNSNRLSGVRSQNLSLAGRYPWRHVDITLIALRYGHIVIICTCIIWVSIPKSFLFCIVNLWKILLQGNKRKRMMRWLGFLCF